jgi:Flp pilus assembly protein TadG
VTQRRRPGRRHGRLKRRPLGWLLHGRDRGSFTAELAAGLPALMLLLLAGLTAVAAVTTKAQCVDAARDGALAAARGEPGGSAAARIAPAGAQISVAAGGDTATASVQAQVRLLGRLLTGITVRASAVAAMEPGDTGALP